jgi:hypothetical protein
MRHRYSPMSTGASADTRKSDASDYDVMLETLDTAIEEAQRTVESGRVYDSVDAPEVAADS